MERKEIEKKVKEILVNNLDIDMEMIKLDSLLVKELGLDSFAAIELVYMLEDEFKIKVSEEEISKLKNVEDVLIAIEQKLQQ